MFSSRIGESQSEVLDVLKLVSSASLELIARGALGHSFGNLEADAPFRHAAKALMSVNADITPLPSDLLPSYLGLLSAKCASDCLCFPI